MRMIVTQYGCESETWFYKHYNAYIYMRCDYQGHSYSELKKILNSMFIRCCLCFNLIKLLVCGSHAVLSKVDSSYSVVEVLQLKLLK